MQMPVVYGVDFINMVSRVVEDTAEIYSPEGIERV
jgi:hypothetical protein